MEKYRRLTRSDRYQIEKRLALGGAAKAIADRLGVHRSTVYREINRGRIRRGVTGGKPKGEYSAREAHRRFLSVFHDSRRGAFYQGQKIKGWVEDQIKIKLVERWSPEQICNRLRIEHGVRISPEAIYKYILSMRHRNVALHKCLRRHKRRRCRFKRRDRYWELQKQRRRSIDSRPTSANNREQPGHWERDLMLGKKNSGAVLTLVDRKTKITRLTKLKGTTCAQANTKTAKILKSEGLTCLSVTNDNGPEFGEFWNLEKEIGAKVYFTHPLCPWERGTVENTIGLLRQFIPKGTDLTQCSESDLREVEKLLNSRPRKSLGFKTPLEVATGKLQKLIKKKRIEPLPPEHFEQYYLSEKELEELRRFRGETVALTG